MDSDSEHSSDVMIFNSLDYLPHCKNQESNIDEELDDFVLNRYNEDQNRQSGKNEEEKNFELSSLHPSVSIDSSRPLLTEEEHDIVSNVKDNLLRRILMLNRTKAMHIKEKLRHYYSNLQKLDKYIESINHKMTQEGENQKKCRRTTTTLTLNWKIGRPYFKSQDLFGCPKNSDVRKKKENRERYTIRCNEGPRWSMEEQKLLSNAVAVNYLKYRRAQLEERVYEINILIKNECELVKLTALQNELKKLEGEIFTLDLKPDAVPPLDSEIDVIDWTRIAVMDLKGKRSAPECKAMWNCYVHPSINKSKWTDEEDNKIKELVMEHPFDWKVVAEKLGTNRSPYLVFIHFNTDLFCRYKKGKFNAAEDQKLMDVVQKCRHKGYIPWGKVKRFFPDRDKYQIYHRYKYYLEKKGTKKGAFTEAEDTLLMHLVTMIGKDFSSVAQAFPQRTCVQLRNRYTTYLEKVGLNLGSFTVEEDRLILRHIREHGDSFRPLANKLNRSRAHIRQRYLTLRRFIEKNPDLRLEDMPRRKQLHLMGYQKVRYERMRKCLKILESVDGVPTLESVEEILKNVSRNSTVGKWKINECTKTYIKDKFKGTIDQKIIDYLKITSRVQSVKQNSNISEKDISASALRIVSLISAFGGNISLFENIKDRNFTENEVLILNKIIESCENIEDKNQHYDDDSKNDNIKAYIPPNLNSLAVVRGLLLYFCMNNEDKDEESSDSDDVKEKNPEIEVVDKHLKKEKEKAVDVLRALFKWPGTLSEFQPEPGKSDEDKIVVVKQEIPRKVGRPAKRVYPKVLKMIEAKQKKEKGALERKNNTKDSKVVANKNDNKGNEDVPKRKKGRPKQTNSDCLSYMPLRRALPDPEKDIRFNNKCTKMPREALMDVLERYNHPSTSTGIASKEKVTSIEIIIQNPTAKETNLSNVKILRKVDPKKDKVLQELLKRKKMQTKTSEANANHSPKIVPIEENITSKRKREDDEVETRDDNKRPPSGKTSIDKIRERLEIILNKGDEAEGATDMKVENEDDRNGQNFCSSLFE